MTGVLSWLVRWACRAGTRDFCFALAALVGLVQKFVYLTVHYFSSFLSPSPSKLGRQSCWATCHSVCVSGCPVDMWVKLQLGFTDEREQNSASLGLGKFFLTIFIRNSLSLLANVAFAVFSLT
jgi:hypothetical protein